jgi:predicted deacylase
MMPAAASNLLQPAAQHENQSMQRQVIDLLPGGPGQAHQLTVLRFGVPGKGPVALIQAALHADEVPAMLVAQALRAQLAALEDAGALCGEVRLVPYANPLGLAQHLLSRHQGRFDLRDGVNFNRGYADLSDAAADAVSGRLTDDANANVTLVRAALVEAAARLPAQTPAEDLKRQLLRLAIDADCVLDLHCDDEAVMHLYGLTPQADMASELGALLGAQAILLAEESGDSPFDEACSRPWPTLARRFAPQPVPLACFSTTVELRGEGDTDHALAAQDASALIEFLRRRGVVRGEPACLPAPQCVPTPLAASEPVKAPATGVVVFKVRPGEVVAAGQVVADIVDVDTGQTVAVPAQSAGVLYARIRPRWALAGQTLAKIAGTTLQRRGKLLSA